MILTNYWKWLNITQTTNAYNNDYYNPTYNIGLIDLNGDETPISPNTDSGGWESRNFENGAIRFGSGTDDVAITDYSMNNDCTSSIGNIEYNMTSSGTEEGFSRTITVTGYNNSGSELTITEVGYAKAIQWYSRDDGWHDNSILFCKTKLNTPLFLPAGANFLIDISWNEA